MIHIALRPLCSRFFCADFLASGKGKNGPLKQGTGILVAKLIKEQVAGMKIIIWRLFLPAFQGLI
jgi:hypothetical protein